LTNRPSGGKFALNNYLAADGNSDHFVELELINNSAKIFSLLQEGLVLRITGNG